MEILKRSKQDDDKTLLDELANKELSRRRFLRFSGIAGASAVILGSSTLAACNKDDDNNEGVNLGSGDIGVLNYAYALEQLEAAFYTQVVKTPYEGITKSELANLKVIRDHEV